KSIANPHGIFNRHVQTADRSRNCRQRRFRVGQTSRIVRRCPTQTVALSSQRRKPLGHGAGQCGVAGQRGGVQEVAATSVQAERQPFLTGKSSKSSSGDGASARRFGAGSAAPRLASAADRDRGAERRLTPWRRRNLRRRLRESVARRCLGRLDGPTRRQTSKSPTALAKSRAVRLDASRAANGAPRANRRRITRCLASDSDTLDSVDSCTLYSVDGCTLDSVDGCTLYSVDGCTLDSVDGCTLGGLTLDSVDGCTLDSWTLHFGLGGRLHFVLGGRCTLDDKRAPELVSEMPSVGPGGYGFGDGRPAYGRTKRRVVECPESGRAAGVSLLALDVETSSKAKQTVDNAGWGELYGCGEQRAVGELRVRPSVLRPTKWKLKAGKPTESRASASTKHRVCAPVDVSSSLIRVVCCPASTKICGIVAGLPELPSSVQGRQRAALFQELFEAVLLHDAFKISNEQVTIAALDARPNDLLCCVDESICAAHRQPSPHGNQISGHHRRSELRRLPGRLHQTGHLATSFPCQLKEAPAVADRFNTAKARQPATHSTDVGVADRRCQSRHPKTRAAASLQSEVGTEARRGQTATTGSAKSRVDAQAKKMFQVAKEADGIAEVGLAAVSKAVSPATFLACRSMPSRASLYMRRTKLRRLRSRLLHQLTKHKPGKRSAPALHMLQQFAAVLLRISQTLCCRLSLSEIGRTHPDEMLSQLVPSRPVAGHVQRRVASQVLPVDVAATQCQPIGEGDRQTDVAVASIRQSTKLQHQQVQIGVLPTTTTTWPSASRLSARDFQEFCSLRAGAVLAVDRLHVAHLAGVHHVSHDHQTALRLAQASARPPEIGVKVQLVLPSAQVVSVARRTQRARLESRLLLHKHPASPGAAAVPHRLAALVEHEQLARTVSQAERLTARVAAAHRGTEIFRPIEPPGVSMKSFLMHRSRSSAECRVVLPGLDRSCLSASELFSLISGFSGFQVRAAILGTINCRDIFQICLAPSDFVILFQEPVKQAVGEIKDQLDGADEDDDEEGNDLDKVEQHQLKRTAGSMESLMSGGSLEPTFDEYMNVVGRRHKYQAAFMVTIALAVAFPSMQIHSVNFTMLRRPFVCATGFGSNNSSAAASIDWASVSNLSSCQIPGPTSAPEATQNGSVPSAAGIPCQRFLFNSSDPMSKTVTESFGLVCGWEPIATVVKVMFMLGFLFGSTSYGILSDRWGRRNAYLLACVNLAVGGVIAAFVKEVAAYAVFRFVTGFAASGLLTVCFAWHTEMQHSRHRFLFTMLMKQGWSAGIFLLTGAAYVTQHWRYLELVISAPALLLLLAHFYVVESPRWLMQVGRACDATAALHKMAAVNGRTNRLDSLLADRERRNAMHLYIRESHQRIKQQQQQQHQQLQHQQQTRKQRKPSGQQSSEGEDTDCTSETRRDSKNLSVLQENGLQSLQSLHPHQLRDKNTPAQLATQHSCQKPVAATAPLAHLLSRQVIRSVAFAVWSVFAMVSFGYYGLSLGWSDFGVVAGGNNGGSSPFVAMALGGCAEVAARVLGTVCGLRLGRVRLLAGSMGVGGAALLLTAALRHNQLLPVEAAIALALTGRFGLLLAFELIWLYASEVFPTPARNSAVGVGSTAARVGGVLAPELTLLSKLWPQLPLVTCGVVSLIGCLLSAAVLPETRNCPAPDTLDEAEKQMLEGRGRGCIRDCGVCRVVCLFILHYIFVFLLSTKNDMISIGSGKITVEFFSADIVFRVAQLQSGWRFRHDVGGLFERTRGLFLAFGSDYLGVYRRKIGNLTLALASRFASASAAMARCIWNCGPYARLLNECHWLVIEALDGGEHPKDISRLLNVKEKVVYSIQQRVETLPAEIACERVAIAKESCSRASGPTATRCSGDEPFVDVAEMQQKLREQLQALEKQLKIVGRDADIPAVRKNLQTVERRQDLSCRWLNVGRRQTDLRKQLALLLLLHQLLLSGGWQGRWDRPTVQLPKRTNACSASRQWYWKLWSMLLLLLLLQIRRSLTGWQQRRYGGITGKNSWVATELRLPQTLVRSGPLRMLKISCRHHACSELASRQFVVHQHGRNSLDWLQFADSSAASVAAAATVSAAAENWTVPAAASAAVFAASASLHLNPDFRVSLAAGAFHFHLHRRRRRHAEAPSTTAASSRSPRVAVWRSRPGLWLPPSPDIMQSSVTSAGSRLDVNSALSHQASFIAIFLAVVVAEFLFFFFFIIVSFVVVVDAAQEALADQQVAGRVVFKRQLGSFGCDQLGVSILFEVFIKVLVVTAGRC
uniref:MFS domain-containing protein n=1 Tax=Macrostomum lignano TaxID=282301 RepID=A0A1I8HMB3_9PLAT